MKLRSVGEEQMKNEPESGSRWYSQSGERVRGGRPQERCGPVRVLPSHKHASAHCLKTTVMYI